MPGINVLIKGLNKVVNFPENTPMETIEQSIKGGWDQVEKVSGLPMDYESRMARAKYLGWDVDDIYTHGSPEKEINEIKKGTLFDGIFASSGSESNHGGRYQHTFISRNGKVAGNGDADFDYEKAMDTIKSEYPGETEEFYDEIYTAAAEDKFNPWDGNPLEAHGFDDPGDASWEAQRIRGKIASEQGFDVVAMSDEHGTSYLIPHGSKARNINAEFNPANRNSGNLLGGLAGGAVGLGALSQSGESEAAQSVNRLLSTPNQSSAYPIEHSMLNKLGVKMQETPQSYFVGGIGKALETISTGRHNELTDESIRKIAIDTALDAI